MGEAREGRGRLSDIDLLPDEAQDEIVWACEQLNERKRTQADILEELNNKLLIKGVGPISRSAFNRFSVKRAMAARRVAEARGVFAGLADQFTPEKVDEQNLVLGEFIKLLVFELAQEDGRKQSAEGAMQLARAYQAVISAQKTSADHRRKAQAEFAAKAAEAVEKVVKATGLSTETRDRLRSEILGIRAEG